MATPSPAPPPRQQKHLIAEASTISLSLSEKYSVQDPVPFAAAPLALTYPDRQPQPRPQPHPLRTSPSAPTVAPPTSTWDLSFDGDAAPPARAHRSVASPVAAKRYFQHQGGSPTTTPSPVGRRGDQFASPGRARSLSPTAATASGSASSSSSPSCVPTADSPSPPRRPSVVNVGAVSTTGAHRGARSSKSASGRRRARPLSGGGGKTRGQRPGSSGSGSAQTRLGRRGVGGATGHSATGHSDPPPSSLTFQVHGAQAKASHLPPDAGGGGGYRNDQSGYRNEQSPMKATLSPLSSPPPSREVQTPPSSWRRRTLEGIEQQNSSNSSGGGDPSSGRSSSPTSAPWSSTVSIPERATTTVSPTVQLDGQHSQHPHDYGSNGGGSRAAQQQAQAAQYRGGGGNMLGNMQGIMQGDMQGNMQGNMQQHQHPRDNRDHSRDASRDGEGPLDVDALEAEVYGEMERVAQQTNSSTAAHSLRGGHSTRAAHGAQSVSLSDRLEDGTLDAVGVFQQRELDDQIGLASYNATQLQEQSSYAHTQALDSAMAAGATPDIWMRPTSAADGPYKWRNGGRHAAVGGGSHGSGQASGQASGHSPAHSPHHQHQRPPAYPMNDEDPAVMERALYAARLDRSIPHDPNYLVGLLIPTQGHRDEEASGTGVLDATRFSTMATMGASPLRITSIIGKHAIKEARRNGQAAAPSSTQLSVGWDESADRKPRKGGKATKSRKGKKKTRMNRKGGNGDGLAPQSTADMRPGTVKELLRMHQQRAGRDEQAGRGAGTQGGQPRNYRYRLTNDARIRIRQAPSLASSVMPEPPSLLMEQWKAKRQLTPGNRAK